MPRSILIATANPGKLREIVALTADLPVRWLTLAEMPGWPTPVEDGPTFRANAEKKARHYADLSGLWTLADDSGLVVDVLGGAPGVHSARYAGGAGDAANNARLIAELRGVPPERRTARFVCCVVLVDTQRILAAADGAVEGQIIDTARGSNGFGYDPHFLIPDLGVTTAELPAETKNRISHRGHALRRLIADLEKLLAAWPLTG